MEPDTQSTHPATVTRKRLNKLFLPFKLDELVKSRKSLLVVIPAKETVRKFFFVIASDHRERGNLVFSIGYEIASSLRSSQ